MRLGIVIGVFGLLSAAGGAASARAPLHDPVSLNIGLNCQWKQRCMAEQQQAMKRALNFVQKQRPAAWRIHQCNRNAARTRFRVDWVGFDNCIRNASLRPAQQKAFKKRERKIVYGGI
jgi:hypothetical protein